MIKVEDRE